MKNKKYFKINEFAKLCHTTKDTLLHYDKMKILTPYYTAENNYRYYTIKQFFEYTLISILKETGSTLHEIKDFLTNYSSAQLIDTLNERIEYLKKEQQKIAERISMFSTLTTLANQALTIEYDKLFFEEREKETIYLFPVAMENFIQLNTCAACYSEFLAKYLKEGGNDTAPPYGLIITKQNVIKNAFKINYLFSRNIEKVHIKTRIIKKGYYACCLHKGTIDSHEQAYYTFLHSLKDQNLIPQSDLFLFDQMNYLIGDNNDIFIIKYAIKIS